MKYFKICLYSFLLAFCFCIKGVSNQNESNFSQNQASLKVRAFSPKQGENTPFDHIFVFDNFPKNKKFILSQSRLFDISSNSFKELAQLSIDENHLITDSKGYCTVFFGLISEQYLKGERVKFKCCYPDGKLIAETSIVISPLHFKSKNGTFFVNAELHSLNPTNYELTYTGIKDGEVVHFRSNSGKETLEQNIRFSSNMGYGYSPDIIGEKGGKSSIKVQRSSEDAVEFDLSWGSVLLGDFLKNYKEFK